MKKQKFIMDFTKKNWKIHKKDINLNNPIGMDDIKFNIVEIEDGNNYRIRNEGKKLF